MSTARRRCLAGALIVGLLAPMAVARAYQRPGNSQRVSLAYDGAEGQSRSVWPTISADGRFVSFESLSLNLVPGDTNGNTDVFVHDRVNHTIERVSLTSSGGQANSWSTGPASMSADGRYVGFESGATNVVPGDSNKVGDVFVRDRQEGTTERVSVSSSGEESRGFSWGSSMSASGRFVAFESIASNLVPDDTNGHWDAFIRDRQEATTTRVSVASDGSQATGVSQFPVISADGRFVAFESRAADLVPSDTNGAADVFVHDLVSGTTERVSVDSDGAQGNNDSTSFARRSISLSGDGRYVAFHSLASNLVPNDTNEVRDVFVHDRETGTTERVSISGDGAEGDGYSGFPWLSADGRYVGFHSAASTLVPGDDNAEEDVFVHDRQTGSTELVSVGFDGLPADRYARFASMTADGQDIAFGTVASNIVPDDTNGDFDIFVRERGSEVGVTDLAAMPDEGQIDVSGSAVFSGATVTRGSDASDDAAFGAGGPAGAELIGAEVIFRPEHEDLFARLEVADLPHASGGGCAGVAGCWSPSGGAGLPSVLYGLTFDIGGTRYEVRSLKVGATSVPPSAPSFALYRCDPSCVQTATLSGGLGTAGKDVRFSVPLDALGAEEGSEVTAAYAFTAVGASRSGEVVPVDRVELADAAIPQQDVMLGLAPGGTPQDAVTFDIAAELAAGSFSSSVDIPSSSSGVYDVWARACLGDTCDAISTPVDLGAAPTPAPPIVPALQRSTTTGHIVAFNPLSASGAGITEGDFFSSGCETPPDSQGVDGHVSQIAPGFGTGTATAVVRGLRSMDAYDLDLSFYSDCEFLGQMATDHPDEISTVPEGTRFIVVNAYGGIATDFRLTVTMPTPSSPTPTSPSPTGSPTATPTDDPQPEATEVSFTQRSATTGQYSDATLWEAVLTDSAGDPIAGAEVAFELAGAGSTRTLTAITGDDGVASVTPTLEEKPGPHQLTVRFAGDDDRAASADTTSFVIDREDSELELTVAGKGNNRTLTARLSDQDAPAAGIVGRTVDFYADGELIGSATTDDDGAATLQPPPRYRGGKHDFEGRFDGDDYFVASSDRERS